MEATHWGFETPTRRRRLAGIAAGSVLGILVAVMTVVPWHQARADSTIQPATGALFGLYPGSRNGLSFLDGMKQRESQLGRKLAIVNKYHNWSDTNYSVEAQIAAQERIPMISWHPTDSGCDSQRADKINAGTYDSLIRTAANNMKAIGSPVLLRWDFEMDQSPGQVEYIGPPSSFIPAWRHIHDIFQQEGATNVLFVWAPRAAAFKNGSGQSFYPGASYVDWIGASSVPESNWASFSSIFGQFNAWASTKGKPLLTWAGIRENPSDANWKASWISGAAQTIKSWPAVKAFVYYDAKSPTGMSYLAHTTARSWAAFEAMANDSYFRAVAAG
jgi:hypothetical protein